MNSIEIDKNHIWHPFEMPESPQALPIKSASGIWLELENGKKIIDAVSSWWITIHGHSHPKITESIYNQAQKLHHVMFAGFTHEPAIQLVKRLLTKLPTNQQKFFFSDNGSTAIEVAIKLCIQYWRNQNKKRTKIIALENSYHGDTFGAMSAGARSVFSAPFEEYLFEVQFLPSIHIDPKNSIETLKQLVLNNDVACFIFEPLIQGAGGINIYPPEVLDELLLVCKDNNIPTIADEVMTGFGKTGKWFATDYCTNKPDLICISKALTGGTLPLAITTCTSEIFAAFDHTSREKGFFHGHTYTGNPLACAAAVASFDLLDQKNTFDKIHSITVMHQGFVSSLINHPKLKNPRSLGTVLAVDIDTDKVNSNFSKQGYLNPIRDIIMESCLESGVLIRPLGHTIYIMPPYCISTEEMLIVYEAILKSLDSI
jgi:adenosylmethionine-8-amino-7-oxononanoate aminotransferase